MSVHALIPARDGARLGLRLGKCAVPRPHIDHNAIASLFCQRLPTAALVRSLPRTMVDLAPDLDTIEALLDQTTPVKPEEKVQKNVSCISYIFLPSFANS
jgi:hypothetical protein